MVAAVAIVIRLRSDESACLKALRCALSIVYHAERKIMLYDSPIEEILIDFDNRSVPKPLSVNRNEGFTEAVQPVLKALRGHEQTVFGQFVEKLGQGYKEDALKLCEFTRKSLEEISLRAEAEYPSRVKLYTALPILCAVSLLVLIL